MQLSQTEENYLKAIYTLADADDGRKLPNLAIATLLDINPATVTEMLGKLADKKLIDYSRREGARLTREGSLQALQVIRKHRLWETFLVAKLGFGWDEVHEIAEQLEHIQSDKLLEQLDDFLGNPKFDPHGDPIPDRDGQLPAVRSIPLSDGVEGTSYRFAGVTNHTPAFLRFLDKTGLAIDDSIAIRELQEFDRSMQVLLRGKTRTVFSNDVTRCLLVLPDSEGPAAEAKKGTSRR